MKRIVLSTKKRKILLIIAIPLSVIIIFVGACITLVTLFIYNSNKAEYIARFGESSIDCRDIIKKYEGKVYKIGTGLGYYATEIMVDGGQFSFFGQTCFGTDGKVVTYKEYIIKEADPITFRVVNGESDYGKDKTHVFFEHETIPEADPNTFTVISTTSQYRSFSKDKRNVYYRNLQIASADPDTFELISNSPFSKDKNNVYFDDKLIYQANPNSFFVLATSNTEWSYYSKDSTNYFFKDKKLNTAGKFSLLDKKYSETIGVDDVHVFIDGNIIGSLNPKKMEIIGTASRIEFIKDDKYVYYKSPEEHFQFQVLSGINAQKFKKYAPTEIKIRDNLDICGDGDSFYYCSNGLPIDKGQVELVE